MHLKTVPNKQRYCGQLQNHVRIANFCGRIGEITIPSSYFFMVFWHGWSCKEVCGAILWVCKTTQQLFEYLLHASMTTTLKKKKWNLLENLSHVCSRIVLKCLYLARFGRSDVLSSVNKFARSITEWTEACDKRQNRLISYIHHTCEYKQHCHVGNTVKLQTAIVSRLWVRGRSWRFEIHFWRNIVRFWKSYICSNKLDVQETNCCFSQFNRIWNHLFGHRTEIGWFARSGTMGSYCFCSWKYFSYFRSNGETCEWWRQTPQVSQ